MNSPRDYSSLKYIIEQPLKDKKSSFSLPKDYSIYNDDRLFIQNQKRNLSNCELIANVSNENNLDEEIYLDNDEINELKNNLSEDNEADQSGGSDTSAASSLISVQQSISLLERLIRTHPIWLLTNLERSEVNHLLQGKKPGTFIVRNSSKPGTMALSVRLPKGKGPYIEHYLIENLGNRKLHLEGSERYFSVIPLLISHYCQCLDELPVCLKLPEILLNASRHQLNSLSLLNEKFWTTNFDEQIYSLSNSDNEKLIFKQQKNRKKSKDEIKIDEKNNNNHILNGNKNESLNRSSQNSIETKELIFDTDDEDHNFIKKEVFNSGSECDNQIEETEVKKHFLMEDEHSNRDANEIEDKKLDKFTLEELKNNEKDFVKKDNDINLTKKENNEREDDQKEIIRPPPRKIFSQQINISPPPLPSRHLKPMSKDYFKITSINESNESSNQVKSIEPQNLKKSVASNLNLLIDFDVLEEEEKLIEQLKENDIFNLNVINAQTQQLMSSQISNINQLNSGSSTELVTTGTNEEKQLLANQSNITKIEINTGLTDCKKMQKKLDETKNKLAIDPLITSNQSSSMVESLVQIQSLTTEIKPLIEPQPLNETQPSLETQPLIDIQPLIGQQSSLIKPLVPQKIETKLKIKLERNEKHDNYEDIWRKPSVRSKKPLKQVETKDCEVQTNAQTILNDLKLESYKNFLVYDYAPNLKVNNQLSTMFIDPIYEERDSLFYQNFFKRNQNLSNPNLNQFNNHPLTKNNSFESLYVTYDSVFSKQQQTFFFERYIVPRDSNLSDVCLQVGDGLIKSDLPPHKTRTELINEERVKQEEKKKDVAWTVDKSWEWGSSSDEELTNSVANKENLSTKYRKYHCKYIIESGVESEDTDGELNEEGLQSMLNDNVRLGNNVRLVESFNESKNGNISKMTKVKNDQKTNSPQMILVDNEEPCSSGFFESNLNNRSNELNLQQTLNHHQNNNKINNLEPQQKPKNEETEQETEDEMVFQEIGLDDVYTTNDELDDNQSLDRVEDIYTIAARNLTYSTVAKSISEYIFELYRLNDNVFAKSINNFIDCTRELYEPNPLIIMRNIRQFMNGMKNYLVKNGEKEFLHFVKHERKRLKAEEFLNLEAIINGCLNKLVIKPLKEFIYQKFVNMEWPFGYESYMKLNENINFLSSRLPQEFEIESNVRLPNNKNMKRIAKFFAKLQNAYSPLKKLEYILNIVSIVNFNTKIIEKQTIDGKSEINKKRIDERTFVSVFIYLLVKFNVVNIEIEIDYIWSLLQSNLISGDANYYLNLLSSCVYVLKINFLICQERNYPLNTIEIQRSIITSYLPSLNDSLNAKCKLSLFQKEATNNLVLPKIIDHPELNFKKFKNSKKRNQTFINQNINELTLVNSNFVKSYPSALNNYKQDSFFRFHILQNNNLSIKLSSLFTVCCLKVSILDEFTGNINCKLIVIRPEMNSKAFSQLIAQKFGIFNQDEHSLFLITAEGKEFQIDDNELPFGIKINALKYGINLSFVYKRTDSQYLFMY